jgi:hypothetical protein
VTDAKNRKLRQALAKRWQDQPRKPDYSRPVEAAEQGFVQPINSKAFSLTDPEDAT